MVSQVWHYTAFMTDLKENMEQQSSIGTNWRRRRQRLASSMCFQRALSKSLRIACKKFSKKKSYIAAPDTRKPVQMLKGRCSNRGRALIFAPIWQGNYFWLFVIFLVINLFLLSQEIEKKNPLLAIFCENVLRNCKKEKRNNLIVVIAKHDDVP